MAERDTTTVITDGYDLYVRAPKRGVYYKVNRRGNRVGMTVTGFTPRPRWRNAKPCSYPPGSLTCERCGSYDQRFAETGEHSWCTG